MLQTESLIALKEAGQHVPGGKSYGAVYHWYRNGVEGVKLECRRFGRDLFTSIEALDRFAARLAEACQSPEGEAEGGAEAPARGRKPRKRTAKQAATTQASAHDFLASVGILPAAA